MSEMTEVTDVLELCAILQCLGYNVKSLTTSSNNVSQKGEARTIDISCQSSGFHVVMESAGASCSCPVADHQNSGIWEVSGIAGGKQHDKESGCTFLRTLPKTLRETFTKELREMVLSIKSLNEPEKPITMNKSASMVELGNQSGSTIDLSKVGNKSNSMLELATPEKRKMLGVKSDTPSRYRSLDALIRDNVAPPLGLMHKQLSTTGVGGSKDSLQKMCHRQSTYTVYSTPGSVRTRNKTSSPIEQPQKNLLENLMEAEIAAENLRNKLATVIKEFWDDAKDNSSFSSMLDMSKISILKSEVSKAQFASSPNLSGLSSREDFQKSKMLRQESASTSNLAPKLPSVKENKSKLRRISPNIFRLNKNTTVKPEKVTDGKSKLQSLFKPKIVTPVRVPKATQETTPNLSSASKKKFSHVKSTIPRPTLKKE